MTMEKRQLLLISNSTNHGSGYLDHCESAMTTFLASAGGETEILFIPFANPDQEGYTNKFRARMQKMGFSVTGLNEADNPIEAVKSAKAFFVGGGNTFLLLRELQRLQLVHAIRDAVMAGVPYIGTSAGSNVACRTINTTNDMPIVQPTSFSALKLVPFNYNAHYLDADPGSQHKGETREQRLREFHQVSNVPVIGVREGSMLAVHGYSMRLQGLQPARIFKADAEPVEVAPGADLTSVLEEMRAVEEALLQQAEAERPLLDLVSDRLSLTKAALGSKIEGVKQTEGFQKASEGLSASLESTGSLLRGWTESASAAMSRQVDAVKSSETYQRVAEKTTAAGEAISQASSKAVSSVKAAVGVDEPPADVVEPTEPIANQPESVSI